MRTINSSSFSRKWPWGRWFWQAYSLGQGSTLSSAVAKNETALCIKKYNNTKKCSSKSTGCQAWQYFPERCCQWRRGGPAGWRARSQHLGGHLRGQERKENLGSRAAISFMATIHQIRNPGPTSAKIANLPANVELVMICAPVSDFVQFEVQLTASDESLGSKATRHVTRIRKERQRQKKLELLRFKNIFHRLSGVFSLHNHKLSLNSDVYKYDRCTLCLCTTGEALMGNQTSDVYMKEGLPPPLTHLQAPFTHKLTEVVVSFAKSLFSLMIATSINIAKGTKDPGFDYFN